MSDLIPGEERESAITEAYNTITGNGEVEWGPETTQEALEKLWDRARLVSPVTREAKLRDALKQVQGIVKRNYGDAQDVLSIIRIALESLSVSPPAEVTDEMVERAVAAWWDTPDEGPGAQGVAMRAALTAALGGGEL